MRISAIASILFGGYLARVFRRAIAWDDHYWSHYPSAERHLTNR